MPKNKPNSQILLSTLWLFVLLNIIFRDLHQLGSEGFLEQLMSGNVNGVELTEGLALIGGILAEIPILMVLLSRILPNKANKWANGVAVAITLAVFATALSSADLDDMFHMAIEVVALGWILRIAWKLPTHENTQS